MILYPHQEKLKNGVYSEWHAGKQRVVVVLPTGGGKTRIMSKITQETTGSTCEIAHRQELVFQISMAHAEIGCYHRIIAPEKIVRFIAARQALELGQSFIHDGAHHFIGSVDTLNARHEQLTKIFEQVRVVQIDETHHVLEKNKWGIALSRFNAWTVGFTATPCRADRKSLRAGSGGLFHSMVTGPDVRELIDAGYLCDFVVYGPPVSIDTSHVDVSKATGDFNPHQLREEAHKSTVTGDMVEHYLRIAPGKLGISFVVDLDLAAETVQRFEAAGVPAMMISANTPQDVRVKQMADFRCELYKQFVNVDIAGEGLDVPGVELVSMGRPTESFPLFRQQAGRALRTKRGKTHGILIDHVGNCIRHGLPDRPMMWSLDAPARRRRRGDTGEVLDEHALTTCLNPDCLRVRERFIPTCPFCGTRPEPAGRDRPDQVDGDLLEYSPELMARLRGEADRITGPAVVPFSAGRGAQIGAFANWNNRAAAQRDLRAVIAQWAGIEKYVGGRADSEIYRRFYLKFGTDIATAQTLGAPDALALKEIVEGDYS